MAGRGSVRVGIETHYDGKGVRTAEKDVSTFSKKGTAGFKQMAGMAGALDGRLGKLAKAASLVGAGYLAIAEGKEAVNVTTDLAKSTISLNKGLGLSVKRASEWAAVAKVRGIDIKALNQGFGTLAKNAIAASGQLDKQRSVLNKLGTSQADVAKRHDLVTKGAGAQADAFKKLGLSQRDLVKGAGDFNSLLSEAADGLGKMEPGAVRTAVAMKLFGKGWQTIVPILRAGSGAMEEQLNLARKYGATFSGGAIKTMQDLIDAQREAKFATLGLQVAVGTQLAPAVTKAITTVTKFVAEMREGKGEAGEISHVLTQAAKEAEHFGHAMLPAITGTIKFVDQHQGIAKMLGTVVALSAAWKGVKFGAAITGISHVVEAAKKLGESRAGVALGESLVSSAKKAPSRIGAALRATKSIVSRVLGGAGASGGSALANNAASSASGQFGVAFDKKSGKMKSATSRTMTNVGKVGGKAMTAGMILGVAGIGAAVTAELRKVRLNVVDPWIEDNFGKTGSAVNKVRDFIGSNLPDAFPGAPLVKGVLGKKRRGGMIGMATGGLVPAILSPGEVGVLPGGGAFHVPGPRVAADTVPMALPAGTAILTHSGQAMVGAGASVGQALMHQAPHFKTGGVAGASKTSGGISNSSDWARALLDRLKVGRSATSIYDLKQWAAIEGGHWHNDAHYNPLNTTFSMPGATSMNSVGVKAYKSWAQGLSATISTLRMAPYKAILGALRNGTFDQFKSAVLGSPWGTTSIPGGPGPKPGTGLERSLGGSYTRVSPAAISHPLLGDMLQPLTDDALLGGIQAGMEGTPRRGILSSVLEGIVPESTDRATRDRVTLPAGKAKGVSAKDAPKIVNWMARRASAIDSKGYPYSTPGNRSFGIGGPMDCSGGVSKVIGPGLLSQVYDSTYFKAWGQPGAGKYLTTYSKGGTGSSGHVFLNLGGKDWGTSSQNPGGGAGWFTADAGYKSQFVARHPKGLRKGGVVGSGILKRLPARFRKNPAVVAEVMAGGVMPGMRKGGKLTEDSPRFNPFTMGNRKIGGGFDWGTWLRTFQKATSRPVPVQTIVLALGANNLGSTNADSATRTLSDRVQGRSMGSLVGAQKSIRGQIRRMSKDGFTGPERIRTRRLRGALSLVQDEMGRPIGRALGRSDRAQDRISRAQSRLPDELIMAGLDPDSDEGLNRQRGAAVSAVGSLEQRRVGLGQALTRAKRTGNQKAVTQVQAEINEVDDQILGLNSSIKGLDQSLKENQPTPRDFNNMNIALASLTAGLDDDKAALQDQVGLTGQALEEAKKTNDPRKIADAANDYKQSIDALTALTEQMTQANELAQQRLDLDKQIADNQSKLIQLATVQGPAMQKAVAMAVSGLIGGSTGLGRLTPSFPGSNGLARA